MLQQKAHGVELVETDSGPQPRMKDSRFQCRKIVTRIVKQVKAASAARKSVCEVNVIVVITHLIENIGRDTRRGGRSEARGREGGKERGEETGGERLRKGKEGDLG